MLGLLGGLRRGESFSLHYSDVDFDRDVIHINKHLFWRFGKISNAEGR